MRPSTQASAIRPDKRPPARDWSKPLAAQIRADGLPSPVLEYPFAKSLDRKFRADLAWPSLRLLVEVDGAVHRIKKRFDADMERDQIIFDLGYRKLRVSPKQVRSGEALQLIRKAVGEKS